jgi:glycosyltransferase involved in cell wall biosynthesis
MTPPPVASLIIAVYDRFRFLGLVFAGLERQTLPGFEIVVADDGSPAEFADRTASLIRSSPLDARYVRHEDRGWRKNEILNRAIERSSSDYLIFIDGDCVPHRCFVEEHVRNRYPRIALTGRRVNLSQSMTARLTTERVRRGDLEGSLLPAMIWDSMLGHASHVENALYLGGRLGRLLAAGRHKGLLGSNFSIHRSELIAINGFDERYHGPGIGEDTDVEYRLGLTGIGVRYLKHRAIQYHLYHPEIERHPANSQIFEETVGRGAAVTPWGITKPGSPSDSRQ